MARPRIKIEPGVVEGMASVGATDREIAEFVGCSVDTLTRRFADILTKSRADLRIKLRRAQLKSALDGNVTMQIWLGKQMLDQSDDKGAKEVATDPQETARQVRDYVRRLRVQDGLPEAA